jgi:hypothetical protein
LKDWEVDEKITLRWLFVCIVSVLAVDDTGSVSCPYYFFGFLIDPEPNLNLDKLVRSLF